MQNTTAMMAPAMDKSAPIIIAINDALPTVVGGDMGAATGAATGAVTGVATGAATGGTTGVATGAATGAAMGVATGAATGGAMGGGNTQILGSAVLSVSKIIAFVPPAQETVLVTMSVMAPPGIVANVLLLKIIQPVIISLSM